MTTQETARDVAVITVGARFDPYTAADVRTRLRRAIDQYQSVGADLDSTEFMDSTGPAVLVGALRYAQGQGREFFVICTREPLLRVLRIMSLTTVLDIRGSETATTTETGN